MLVWSLWRDWWEHTIQLEEVFVGRHPPGEDLKLNVDAVVRSDSGFFGVGAIIRDAQGVVRACLAKKILEAHSPFVAECQASREGLEFARTCNLRVDWIE
ncbi:hypothetical protein TIFTF001_046975 [Ficus carica]|uniref:RNase H type-1 domain-containing protein n=1 Tax=Ficus carica TaxID=3494 RepID=A0AA88CJ91_FICCA|nr:hypothetical protein TIFTF001_046975 [Ficus carica]